VQSSSGAGGQEQTVRLSTKFPTGNFTLALHGWTARRVRCGGTDLKPVTSMRDFRSGTFLAQAGQTFVALDLPMGTTTLTTTR